MKLVTGAILFIVLLFSVESSHTATGLTMTSTPATTPPLQFYYFGLFAKVGSLLALEHSGLSYEYKKPEPSWGEMKQSLSWKCLPCLKNLPNDHLAAFSGGDGESELGQEVAILQYIAARSPDKMRGATLSEEIVSHQLIGEGEDIYQALVKIKAKLVSEQAARAFWEKDQQDATSHNRFFGAYVFMELLEKFLGKCGGSDAGKFTTSGCTVGECKLWASLHCVYMIDPTVLGGFPGVRKFYHRFKEEPATRAILSGDRTGGPLQQYFFKPE